ncbi:MAG: hypothetical protein QXO32_01405 [Candidatus Bathyarchaeia archaeon]
MRGLVLYPWRIELAFMAFSKGFIQKRYIQIADYVNGYGIGEFPQHELTALPSTVEFEIGVEARLKIDLKA